MFERVERVEGVDEVARLIVIVLMEHISAELYCHNALAGSSHNYCRVTCNQVQMYYPKTIIAVGESFICVNIAASGKWQRLASKYVPYCAMSFRCG